MKSNIFSVDNLCMANINEVTTSDIKNMAYCPDNSYVIEAIEFISNSNIEYNAIKRNLYKTISESAGDDIIIHEGFVDFFSGLKKIIDKFLAFVKSLFEKFIISFNKLIKRDKYIINHKKDFDKFDNEKHKFSFEGYNFTTDTYPIIGAYELYTNDLEDLGNKLNGILENKDKISNDELLNEMELINSSLRDILTGDFYDNLRGSTIGKDSITDTDYQNECFATFRNDNSDKEVIDVTKSYIDLCLNKFEVYSKAKETVEKLQKKTESEYNSIKKFTDNFVRGKAEASKTPSKVAVEFSKINMEKIKTLDLDKKNIIISELDKYMKLKSDQVQEMSNIHALVFGYKLDAMKEEYIQNRNVLFKALSKVKSIIKEDAKITININISKEEDEDEEPENIELLSSDHSEEDDNIEPMPFANEENEEPEVPVDYTNREEKDFEDAIKDLNAVESDEIEEAVNIAINTNSPSSLLFIESAKNKNFGRTLLESMINNRVKYMTKSEIDSEKIVVEQNIKYIQNKLSSLSENDKINKCAALIESYKMYLNTLSENANKLSKIDLSHYDYVLEMTNAISKLKTKLDMIDQTRYIKECILFSSDKPSDVIFNELALLEADDPANKKSAYEKFKEFILKIWNKFVERVTYFSTSNKKYLDKYKDTILKKTPTIEVSMKDYATGIVMMTSTPIPAFNINDFDKDTTKESFKQKILGSKTLVDGTKYESKSDEDTFKSYCVDLFTGGPKERSVSGDSLKMSDIFDFCYDYEGKIKPSLEKDKVTIEKSANDIGKLIENQTNEINRKKEEEQKKQQQQQQNNKNGNTNDKDGDGVSDPVTNMPKDQQTSQNASAVFSIYKNKFITEMEISSGSSSNGNTTSNKASDNLNSSSGEGSSEKDIKSIDDTDKLKQLKDSISIYNEVVGQIMSAKISAAETIYNDYMKIIIAHVRNQINTNNGGVSRDTQNRTDYSNNQQPENNNQQQNQQPENNDQQQNQQPENNDQKSIFKKKPKK